MRLAFILIASIASCLFAENWPQWRGPDLNGESHEKNLPLKWSQDENITWKISLPSRSGATPIIWGEKILLNVASGDNLELWCLNRNDGSVLWKSPIGGGNYKINKQNMSSPSPSTDGKTIFAMTGTGIIKAFSFDGKELWMRDVQKDYGKFGLNWGYGSSPLLYNGMLYVEVLHGMKTTDPSYLLKLDIATGKTLVKMDRPTPAIHESPDAYTTPTIVRNGSAVELVVSGGDIVTGHDPVTLKELWRANVLNPSNNPANRIIASPMVRDGMIYAASRVRPYVAIKPGGHGDVSESHVVWKTQNGPDVPTPVSDGKYLWVVNDRGIMWCFDAKTGADVYSGKRIQSAIYSSSPVLADGRIYATNEEGTTTVVKASGEFEVLAENKLGEYTLSSPAISEGQIFMRTEKALYCIGKRAKK